MTDRYKKILSQALYTEMTFGVDAITEDEWNKIRFAGQGAGELKNPDSWEALEREALACRRCRLCQTRTNVVFGEGHAKADLVFVGEGPGFDEDLQGRPFVGAAGQLLTKIIGAMGLKREDVYIANCVKCRPPGNRNPSPDEIACCQPLLERQLSLIKPKIICALGKFAAHNLLRTERPISRLRGVFGEYLGIKVMPTFHPAYLLRNPYDKKLVWEDMQKIMSELGLKAGESQTKH